MLSSRHKYFWITILVLATLLSLYWSIVLFIDWQGNPVQTTVVTSALDIKEVPFPSVTICHDGYYYDGIINNLKEEYYFFIKNTCFEKLFRVCVLYFLCDIILCNTNVAKPLARTYHSRAVILNRFWFAAPFSDYYYLLFKTFIPQKYNCYN